MKTLHRVACWAGLALVNALVASTAFAQGFAISPVGSTVGTGGGATNPVGINIVFTGGNGVNGYIAFVPKRKLACGPS